MHGTAPHRLWKESGREVQGRAHILIFHQAAKGGSKSASSLHCARKRTSVLRLWRLLTDWNHSLQKSTGCLNPTRTITCWNKVDCSQHGLKKTHGLIRYHSKCLAHSAQLLSLWRTGDILSLDGESQSRETSTKIGTDAGLSNRHQSSPYKMFNKPRKTHWNR